jgi:transcriptional regulator with PAS, ATPase and Fis domain
MLSIKEIIRKYSKPEINLPILILGETGTGKELVAQALAAGRKGPFVPVNCGGIPDTLLESEFFGSVKGSFTGATDRRGYVEEAEGGTLFLDEIGDMPLMLQCKLLRLLQSRKFRRVGETIERPANFRLVSATNCRDLTESKTFRLDLYYRLAGDIIKLPTLFERGYDYELIIKKFAKPHLVEKLIKCSCNTVFKGNIRELNNLIEKTNILEG